MAGVAGVVLAAGAGTRFGGPKALARLDGERLVDRAVATLRRGGCSEVVVVQGAARLDDVDAVVVDNPEWETGMGSSLRVALRYLASGDSDAAVVLLVDTPWVGSVAVARLLGALGTSRTGWAGRPGVSGHRDAGHDLGGGERRDAAPGRAWLAAQATYGGIPGHPVLLARAIWDDVAASAVGDRGARAWLRAHRDLVLDVPSDGTGDPRDVDRPADLLEGPPQK